MWNPLDHEICPTYMPQTLKVLCIGIRDYILPGAKHGASCKQAPLLLGEADRSLKGLLPRVRNFPSSTTGPLLPPLPTGDHLDT